MRERLIALIEKTVYNCKIRTICHGCKEYGKGAHCVSNAIADHLLANGVIVPPCKVGDVIYSPRDNDILEQNVISIEIDKKSHVHVYFTCDYLCDGCPHSQPYQNQAGDGGCYGEYGESYYAFDDFGKTVFLTREEAEQALKGEHHG